MTLYGLFINDSAEDYQNPVCLSNDRASLEEYMLSEWEEWAYNYWIDNIDRGHDPKDKELYNQCWTYAAADIPYYYVIKDLTKKFIYTKE